MLKQKSCSKAVVKSVVCPYSGAEWCRVVCGAWCLVLGAWQGTHRTLRFGFLLSLCAWEIFAF